MSQRYEIIDKATVMVNEFSEFRRLVDRNALISEELDLRVTRHIQNFRLIGETALFFAGTYGVERLLNAVHDAGGDFLTAQIMLDGLLDE
jgi:hypothetical protein